MAVPVESPVRTLRASPEVMSRAGSNTSQVSGRNDDGHLSASPIPTSPTIQRVVDGGLFVCLAVLGTLIATGLHGPLRVVLAFIFAMLAPGWVVTGYWGSLPLYLRVIASIGASIGICVAVTSMALWLKLWYPNDIFVILFILIGLSLAWRICFPSTRVSDHERGERRDRNLSRVEIDSHRRGRQATQLARSVGVADFLFLLALFLWGVGVATTNLSRAQGDNGLVPALPWSFWAGILLLLLSVAIRIRKPVLPRFRLGASAAALVVMFQAPIALLYDAPRYVYDFKTVGEVQYDNLHGALNASLDIYQHWPGFFGLMAWFGQVAGIANPVSYLTWSPLFFDLLAVAAFGFAISSLPMTEREKWLAVFLFYGGDWVFGSAQDIFTPQALAFPMFFIVIGLVLRWYLAIPPLEFERSRRHLARFRPFRFLWRGDKIASPFGSELPGPLWQLSDWKQLALIAVVFAPLVITHPLSPFVVVLELGVLTVMNRIRPLWISAFLGALAVAYLIPNLGYLMQGHQLLTGPADIAVNAAPPQVKFATHLGPNHIAIPAITLVLYGLAALGAFNRRNEGRDVRTIASLAVAPFLLITLVHYGGETLYRSLLFSTPWAACLAASAIWWGIRREPAHRKQAAVSRSVALRVGATCVATVTLAVLAVVVQNSQNELYQVSPGDVAGAQWLYAQRPGVAIFLNGEFPARVGGRYDQFVASDLTDVYLGDLGYTDASIQSINDFACKPIWGDQRTAYIVLSDNEASFAIHAGYAKAGFLTTLRKKLYDSPKWQLVFQNSTTTIYRGPSSCY